MRVAAAPWSLTLLALLPLLFAGMGSAARAERPPAFTSVSVHDPSIVEDGGVYYVFGTHIAAARSEDLIRWRRFTNGYATPGNALYGDLSANLAESFAWAGENDADSLGGFAVWAPDVIWLDDFVNKDGSLGAYLIYYSVSSTYIRSAIGIAASKRIEGPYEYVDTIVYSGFTRREAYDANSRVNKMWTNTHLPELIAQGVIKEENPDWFNPDGSYRNAIYPNAIDPALFWDEAGRLWMAYGSWSGGIFLLEIDPSTGRPLYPGEDGLTADGRLIDRYFGVKISGGFGRSGEGPYIVFDKERGYYYLFVTYGWLGADGGYNMRVFRSRSPDGPYVDGRGRSAVLPAGLDNYPFGNKLMGNFLFERQAGDPGIGPGIGYVSPGHNSVLLDPKTGRWFLVFHTRFPNAGEHHELRVHQLFMNEDGWPVAAPYRYAGEEPALVSPAEIPGPYRYINHGKTNTPALRRSSIIHLNDDFTISGAVSGTWRLYGEHYAELDIEGAAYRGVFVRNWDPTQSAFVMTFTATSEDGVAVWGARAPQ